MGQMGYSGEGRYNSTGRFLRQGMQKTRRYNRKAGKVFGKGKRAYEEWS